MCHVFNPLVTMLSKALSRHQVPTTPTFSNLALYYYTMQIQENWTNTYYKKRVYGIKEIAFKDCLEIVLLEERLWKSMRNQNIIDVHKNYLFKYACLFSSTNLPPLSGHMHHANQEIVDEAFMTIRWCFLPLITTCTNLTWLLYIRHSNPPWA